ncbi:MAG TPA: 16S rRNA (guanine(966)-N(2))-methyltransferase RsmD [Gammaproteobacteria bacterium]|nr:16S rRNA (guanine(966)-N(2))-methyltransferase RsmD [Gammaproteobacteria bacterium]
MTQKRANSPVGKLRIIGGRWRSRQLPVAALEGLRPTTDRVRETLFNWLQGETGGAHCLDLFAGSGALGFEAASRGAASVLMLELQAPAVAQLKDNIKQLQAESIQIVREDALEWLKTAPATPWDIVFIDPPFASDYLAQTCGLLENGSWLAEKATIYLEMDSARPLPALPANWHIVKEKKAGQVCYYLAKRNFTEN